MKVPAPRPIIAFVLAIIIVLVLMSCFGARSNRVVKAADRAFESSAVEALATGSEASLMNAANAAPFALQSPVMGCSAPSFSAPSYFGIGGGTIPCSIAVADFNLDGKPDLVTANQTTHNVSVLLGNGSGTYATAATFPSGAVNPTAVAVSDFNLDGKPDVAVSNISGSVSVLSGNGSGGFGVPLVLSTAGGADEVVTGDFNTDGQPDMAVAKAFANGVSVFLGNGMGGFAPRADFPAGTTCFSLRTADFNGDGKLDIATANSGGNNVSILLGNGSGGFGGPNNFPVTAGSSPRSIRFGDFDQDGDMDLVTANSATANVAVLLNNGSGSFGAATDYPTGTSPLELSVGDLNLDGKPDIAVTNSGASNVSVLLGNGSGGFGVATNLPVNNSVRAVVAADLNLDGRLDLVMRSATAVFPGPSIQNVAVLLNTCSAQPCSSIEFAEAMGSPYSQGTGPSTDPIAAVASDFNVDGKPDVAVANFGTNNIMILLGNGGGGFAPAAGSPFAAGSTPSALAVGDYNLDGKPDLAIANGIFPGTVTILLNNGSGGFAPAAGSPVSLGLAGALSITAGDFNLDGKLDLATANGSTHNVSVLLGNGSGGFAPAASSPVGTGAGTNPRWVGTGDFNLDGKPDLATANADSNNVTILLGDGSGGFAPAADSPIATGGTFSQVAAIGDFNLDGKPDLAVGNGTTHNVTILLGDGSGGFAATAGSPIAGTFFPITIAANDFDADGKPDLIVGIAITEQLAVLRGDGNGGFALSILNVPGDPGRFAASDYNLDGRLDLATANVSADNVRILLNTCPQNAAPSITTTPVTLQQTTSALNTQIATVSDMEDAAASLIVTIDGGTSSIVNGVTVSNLSVDAMGVVRADVDAACGSSNAAFTLTVTDTGGASNTATLDVTVTPETVPPTLSCPADITQSTDPGQCLASISYTTPTASDNCPGATVACNPPTASTFSKGVTTVTCTATDAAGNTANCSFTVTVNDTENPLLTCPENITQGTDNNECQAVVNYPEFGATDNCPEVGTPTCNPTSGSTFQKGTTTVNCSVSDASGNSASCSFTVTVNDLQAPTITCPANIVVPAANNQCDALVNYPAIIVSDNCSGVGTPICNPPTGSTFQKGTTTVNCSVSDGAGLTAGCSFTVTVNDTQPPTIACPANVTIASNTCVSNAYTPPGGSDNCMGVTVLCNPPPSTCFPVGTTTVTCTATDTAKNTANCSFTVTIAPCTITCPANLTQSNDAGQCAAIVNYAQPTTTGSCGSVSCSPSSGSSFPKGTTTVTCTTTVGPSCTFTVTVNDTQAPTISCPANVAQANDKGQCQAVVNYPNATATDNCPGVGTPKCSPASGSIFPKGVTTVTCTVSDANGNPNSCNFTVTVNDSEAPTITCPANISMPTTTGQCARVVTYAAPAVTDNCDKGLIPSCLPPSGSSFAKGVTTVNCTVADSSGNPKSCSFTVTINDTERPQITCPPNLIRPTDTGLCTAIVTYTPMATDNCPGVTVTCNPPSGSSFPKGSTSVSCVATDTTGNTAICLFFVTVNDTQAPSITCPANQTRALAKPTDTTVIVTYPSPVFSDNCPGTSVACLPPSGSAFPVGVTTVSCTATDAANNKTSCSFLVTVFDVCLQDDANASTVLLFNSFTGDYLLCSCGGTTFTGRGTVQKLGSTYTLTHNTAERRVSARLEGAMNRGTASLQSPVGTMRCTISDRDIRNNSCLCQ
jgi:hypothetical protein